MNQRVFLYTSGWPYVTLTRDGAAGASEAQRLWV